MSETIKFVVGQKVRALNFEKSGGDNEYVGQKALIDEVRGEDKYRIVFPDGNRYCVVASEIKALTLEEAQVNFLLVYMLDRDPVEEYATLDEVKARIAHLVKTNTSLKKESIVVHEVKASHPVTVETVVTIKGI